MSLASEVEIKNFIFNPPPQIYPWNILITPAFNWWFDLFLIFSVLKLKKRTEEFEISNLLKAAFAKSYRLSGTSFDDIVASKDNFDVCENRNRKRQ